MRALLNAQGWADDQFHTDLDAQATELTTAARSACLALDPPPLEATFTNTLVKETPQLRLERERFTAYMDSFE
jgi:2-oxoisovalerate dehydrogenase E1 component alpha subunit